MYKIKDGSDSFSYQWDNKSTENTQTYKKKTTSSIPQTYNVRVTDNYTGCSNTSTHTIKGIPLPIVSISGLNSVCEKDSVTLSAQSLTEVESYDWTVSVNNVKLTSGYRANNGDIKCEIDTFTQGYPYTFEVSVTDAIGCVGKSEPYKVTNKPNPVFDIDTVYTCYGDFATLKVGNKSTADLYVWPDGTQGISQWIGTDTIKKDTSYVIMAKLNDCPITDTAKIKVLDLPVFDLDVYKQGSATKEAKASDGSVSICSNDNDIIIVANKTSGFDIKKYYWKNFNDSTESHLYQTPNKKTIYTAKLTDENGCSNQKSQTILVNIPEVITIEGPDSICENGAAEYIISGSANYELVKTGKADATLTGDTIKVENVKGGFSLEVKGQDNHGCKSDAVIKTVKMTPKPQIELALSPAATICSGVTVTMSAKTKQGISIQWDGLNVGFLDNIQTLTNNGTSQLDTTFYVTATTTDGCIADSFITLTVNPLPIFTTEGKDICFGNDVTLTVNETFKGYNWEGKGVADTQKDQSSVTIQNVQSDENYKVTVYDNNNCQKDTTVKVIVHNNPIAQINRAISGLDDNRICKDSILSLSEANTGDEYSHEWYNVGSGNNRVTYLGGGNNIKPTITNDSTFRVLVTKVYADIALSCVDSTDYIITAKYAPKFVVVPDTVCVGSNAKVEIKNGESGVTYNWAWKSDSSTDTTKQIGGSSISILNVNDNIKVTTTGTKESCPHDTTVYVKIHKNPEIGAMDLHPICINGDTTFAPTVTLDATYSNAIDSYSWKANKDANSINYVNSTHDSVKIAPQQVGSRFYTVTVIDKYGCESSRTDSLLVNALPTINIEGETKVCPNTNASLTVNGFNTVTWYAKDTTPLETNKTFKPFITHDTTFYVGVTDASNCNNLKEVKISVKAIPTISANGNRTICKGEKTRITLIGNSGGTFEWLNGGASGDTTLSPTDTTKYKVIAHTSNGCVDTTEFVINVNKLPNVLINNKKYGDTVICLNEQVHMTASGANSYQWSNRSTETSYEPTPIIDSKYWVIGYDAISGCKDTAKFDVTIKPLPVIETTGDIYVCKDKKVELEVSNPIEASTVQYMWYKKENSNIDTIAYGSVIPIDSIKTTTTYYVEMTKSEGNGLFCHNTASQKVIIKDIPVPTIIPEKDSVCDGDYILLNATSSLSSTSFSWKGMESTNNSVRVKINPISNDTTFRVYTSKNGCVDSSDITITKLALPELSVKALTTSDNIICYNDSVILQASAKNGTPGYTYAWDMRNIDGVDNTSRTDTSTATTVRLTNTISTYKFPVKVTDVKGCVGRDTALINVQALPSITINGERRICDGDSSDYQSVVTNGTAVKYLWKAADDSIGNKSTQNVKVEGQRTITVTVTTDRGCVNTSSPYTINTYDKPELTFVGDTVLCNGESTTIRVSGAGSEPSNYKWSGATITTETTGLSQVLSPRRMSLGYGKEFFKYFVNGTDKNGCKNTDSFYIAVNPKPSILINGSSNGKDSICDGGSQILSTSTSDVITSYKWNTGASDNNITVKPNTNTEYRVIATNEFYCTDTALHTIVVFKNPTIDIDAPAIACDNSTITLKAVKKNSIDSEISYKWRHNNASDNTTTMVVQSDTIVYVTASYDVNGLLTCSSEAQKTIVKAEIPNVSIAYEDTICYGVKQSYQLAGSEKADFFIWPTTNNETSISQFVESNIQEVGQHDTVVKAIKRYNLATTSIKCTQTIPVSFNVYPNPTVTIAGPAFVCTGESVNLYVKDTINNSITGIKWSTDETTDTISVAPTMDALYSVTLTNQYGCSTEGKYNLSAHTTPKVNIKGETSYCQDSTIDIYVDGNNLIYLKWTYVKGGNEYTVEKGNPTQTTLLPEDQLHLNNVTISEDMNISVQAINDQNCSATGDIQLTKKDNPILTLNAPTYVCKGSDVTISASGATTYEWENLSNTRSSYTEKAMMEEKTFRVFGTTNGCTANEEITVNVWDRPEISIFNGISDTATCYKDSIILIAQSTGNTVPTSNYEWQGFSDKSNTIKVAAINEQKYIVYGSDNNGCLDTAEIIVKINPLPKFDFTYPQKMCDNSTDELVANKSELRYIWGVVGDHSSQDFPENAGNTTHSIKLTDTTSFYALAQDAKGCVSDSVKHTIMWKPNPEIVITTPDTICYGMAALLKADDNAIGSIYPTSFTWKNSDGDILKEGGYNYNTGELKSATKFIIVGEKEGCVSQTDTVVRIWNLPAITISDKATGRSDLAQACKDSEVELTATVENAPAPYLYKWDDRSSSGLTTENTSEIQLTPKKEGEKHLVIVTDYHGCKNSDTIEVHINALPDFTVNGVADVCSDTTNKLFTTPITKADLSYNWYQDTEIVKWIENGETITGENRDTIYMPIHNDAVLLVEGSYVINGITCKNSQTFEVKSKTTPTIKIGTNDTTICWGSAVSLVVSGNSTRYDWTTGEGDSINYKKYNDYTLIDTVTQKTKFIVEGELDGCKKQASVVVDIYQLPKVEISADHASICYGKDITLTATQDVNYTKYQWKNISSQNILGSDSAILIESPKIQTSYAVYVTEKHTTNGTDSYCENSDTFTIAVNELPIFELESNSPICEGSDAILTATSKSGPLTYQWDGLENETFTSESSHSYGTDAIGSVNNYTYQVLAKDTNGCVGANNASVQTKLYPQANIDAPDSLCYGSQATITGKNAAATYEWYDVQGTDSTQLSTASNFTTDFLAGIIQQKQLVAKVTMQNCTKDSSFVITPWNLPNIKIERSPSISICEDFTDTLVAQGSDLDLTNNLQVYKWDNNAYSNLDSFEIAPTTSGTIYHLAGKDKHNCENFDSIKVNIEERPVFTLKSDSSICANDTSIGWVEVSAISSQSLNYQWKDKNGNPVELYTEKRANSSRSSKVQMGYLPITQDTTLYVTGKSLIQEGKKGCEQVEEITIKADPYPSIIVVKDPEKVCIGSYAYIQVRSDINADYLWNNGNTSNYIQEIVNNNNTTFSVSATSEMGCKSSKDFKIDVWELPVVKADTVAICYNDSVSLKAICTKTDPSTTPSLVTYKWNATTKDTSVYTTPRLTSPTSYTIKVTDEHGCVGSATAKVSINPLPDFTLIVKDAVCRGQMAEIYGSKSNLTYNWNHDADPDNYTNVGISKFNSYKINDLNPEHSDTAFTVWAKDENGCVSNRNVTVHVKEYPVLSLRMDTNYVCYGEEKLVYVSGANDGYSWKINDVINDSKNNYVRLSDVKELQKIHVEGTTNKCTSELDTTLNVWALPNIQIEASKNELCLNETVRLKGTNGKEGEYKWQLNGSREDSIDVIVRKVGINSYMLTGKDENGCSNKDTIDILVDTLPVIQIDGLDSICVGGVADLSARGAEQYIWTNNSNDTLGEGRNFTPSILFDTTFTVIGKDGNGCVSNANIEMTAKAYPILTYHTSTGKDSVCNGNQLTIYVNGAESYVWLNENNSNSYLTQKFTEPKSFKVIGTTKGCPTDTTITIGIWKLPEPKLDGPGAICFNQEAELSVSHTDQQEGRKDMPISVKWRHNGSDLYEITDVPSSNKWYYVTSTDTNSCRHTDSIFVKVNPLPSDVIIDGETAICKDSVVSLTAVSDQFNIVRYAWHTQEDGSDTTEFGKYGNPIDVRIDQDSIVYVTVTDINTCQYTTSHKITSKAHPTLIPSAPEYVCDGNRTTISVRGATEYIWDNESTNSYRTVTINQDTIFHVKGIANGCESDTSIKIKKWELPIIDIKTQNEKYEICRSQDSLTLIAVGGEKGGYTWNTRDTSDKITISPLNDTRYEVIGTDNNGCQNKADTTIIVHPLPVISIEGEGTMCENDTITLKVNTDEGAVQSYTWNTDIADWNDTEIEKDSQYIDVKITKDTRFEVIVTDTFGCWSKSTKDVKMKEYPKLKFPTPNPNYICYGNSTTITVEGANSYLWEDGTTQRSFITSPTHDSTYIVAGTTNGCTTIDSLTIEVKKLPTIEIEGDGKGFNGDSICYGDMLNLTAYGAGDDIDNNGHYTWNTGISNDVLTVSPLSSTTYTVVGTDKFGCSNDTDFTVGVIPLPEFEVKGQELICQNDTNKIWVEYDYKELEFEWEGTFDMLGDSIYPIVAENTTYYVTATDPYECQRTKSLAVKIKPYPVLNDDAPDAVCDGSQIKITVTGATEYEWCDGTKGNTFTDIPAHDTTYYVLGTTNGCTTIKEYPVKILDLPLVVINGESHDLCAGRTMPLLANGAKTFIWSTGKSNNRIDIRPSSTTTYSVIGTDANGCSNVDSFTVNVRPIPQVTIDGDYAVCEGEEAEIYVVASENTSPLNIYTWRSEGEIIGSTDTINPIINTTQSINLYVMDIYGCDNTASTTIKSKPIPSLVVTPHDTVCTGRSVSLIVAGANAYEWINNGTSIENETNTLTKNMDVPGSQWFKVRGTTDGCTSDWYDMDVEVVTHPSIRIEGDKDVCINDYATLRASGISKGTYIWSEGTQNDSIVTKPMSTTTYSVIGYDQYGCEGTAEMEVRVNFPPEISIDGPKTVCSDKGDLTLTVNNRSAQPLTYTWDDDETNHNQIREDHISSPKSYRVEAIDANGCKSYAEHTVSITKNPKITLTGNMNVCENEQIVISAFGSATDYLWSNGNKTNQLNILAEFDYTTAIGDKSTKSFRVYGSLNGCESHADTTVIINKKPQLSYEGNTVICQGDKLEIKGLGAQLYSWSNGTNAQILETRPITNTRYTMTGISENGCRNAIDIPITVYPQPQFTISGDNQACRGESAHLSAVGSAIIYQWGFGNNECTDAESGNENEIAVPINSETQVFVRAIDVNNCTSTQSTKIKALEPPTLYYSGNTKVCAGESVILTAQGASSYYWIMGGDTTRGMNFSFRPKENTRINLHGTLGHCSSDLSVYVQADPAPDLSITSKDVVCKNEEAILTANGALYFEWSTGETTRSIAKPLTNSMTYTVKGIGYNGCSAIASKTIHVNQLPPVRLITKKDGCPQSETTVDLVAKGAKHYTWSCYPPVTEIATSIDDSILGAVLKEPTTIIVHGTDENNCESSDTTFIEPVPYEPIQFTVSPGVIEHDNPIISLKGFYPENALWYWDPGDYSETIERTNALYTYPEAGTRDSFIVKVKAVDKRGCEYHGDTTIYVWKDFWVPNAFTPNNDGDNDVFRFLGTELMTDFHFIIFDRSGRIVFTGDDKDAAWDGTCDGKECAWGVYGYVVNYKSTFRGLNKGGERRGTVTLIR